MDNNNPLDFKKADYILVVNKDYEIVYNSRFDKKLGAESSIRPYRNFFEMYPSQGRRDSSIVKAMSTGAPVYNSAQEWTDIKDNYYQSFDES